MPEYRGVIRSGFPTEQVSVLTDDIQCGSVILAVCRAKLGIEYPAAIHYHVMNLGDHRANIFRDKADPERLLGSLRWVTPRGRRPNPVVYKMQADAERKGCQCPARARVNVGESPAHASGGSPAWTSLNTSAA